MKKETRKLELIMAIIFMIFHIVMVLEMEAYANQVYMAMCVLFALSAWVLIGRLAWDKFKKDM